MNKVCKSILDAYCHVEGLGYPRTDIERRVWNQMGMDRYIHFRYQWCDFRGRLYHI